MTKFQWQKLLRDFYKLDLRIRCKKTKQINFGPPEMQDQPDEAVDDS